MTVTVPWWMFDLDNKQLIVSRYMPSDIVRSQEVAVAEITIPGLNHRPVHIGSIGNENISFTINVVKKGALGTVLMLKQLELLRDQVSPLLDNTSSKFRRNPKVLYSWGTGMTPQVYYVKPGPITNPANHINQFGNPEVSRMNITLVLDKTTRAYKMETRLRQVAATVQTGLNIAEGLGVI